MRSALLLQLPKAFLFKAYAKASRWINGRVLVPMVSAARIKAFHQTHQRLLGDHFYMIVMPGTLHYLMPCLALIPDDIQVFLIFNGAKRWEQSYLRKRFPHLHSMVLCTLPNSSVSHGEVLSLFFRSNEGNFGVLDHDLYLFDPGVFRQLQFDDRQCMKATFYSESGRTGLSYPETFFMFFNTAVFKEIMRRYDVDARIYRRSPRQVQDKLAHIGLCEGRYMKDYHNYFDTLHVMLALAYCDGYQVDYVEIDEETGVYHMGGTSMGSPITKDLFHLYSSLRFLELVDDPELSKKYANRHGNFRFSLEVAALLPSQPEVLRMMAILNRIIGKLEAHQR